MRGGAWLSIRSDKTFIHGLARYCAAAVTATATTNVTGIPPILLEVVDLEDPSPVGSNQTYVITVTKQGPAPGTNIRVVATLEANQTYVSSQDSITGTASGSTVTFATLPSLGARRITVSSSHDQSHTPQF